VNDGKDLCTNIELLFDEVTSKLQNENIEKASRIIQILEEINPN